MKSKVGTWGFSIAGILWLTVGLRDTFAPGFFSINGRVVASSQIALDFAVAGMFLALAGSMVASKVNWRGK